MGVAIIVLMVPQESQGMLLAANGHVEPQGYMGECGVEPPEIKHTKKNTAG